MNGRHAVYGLLAEFDSARDLLRATRAAREAGYRELEAYSPFPVEGLAEAVGLKHNRVALVTLLCGILGGAGGYFLPWYSAVIDYPFNAGGRPLHSWPAFSVVALEMAILGAALAAFVGMLLMNGLPRLRHPVFNAERFDLGGGERFFLCIKADDPAYEHDTVARLLTALEARSVTDVPLD